MKPEPDTTQQLPLLRWVKAKVHAIAWVHAIRWLRYVTPRSPRRFSHHLPSCAEFVDTNGNVVQYATLWYWCWLVTSTWK